MNSTYAVRSPIFLTNTSYGISFVRDALPRERKQNVDFHIKSGDYFGTLATIMGLMADSLSNKGSDPTRSIKTLDELREDLCYAQETYRIEPKD
ncbi:MAG: hypothetical protein P4L81_06490 [Candidatus Pacebacteria bacterium]|nr:hypothetical protein [Candidatus Paceibacterota bacterium]